MNNKVLQVLVLLCVGTTNQITCDETWPERLQQAMRDGYIIHVTPEGADKQCLSVNPNIIYSSNKVTACHIAEISSAVMMLSGLVFDKPLITVLGAAGLIFSTLEIFHLSDEERNARLHAINVVNEHYVHLQQRYHQEEKKK